jgi:hypothetical protein
MLDVLGRRPEAIAAYQKALNTPVEEWRYDQYGIVLTKAYVELRLKTPFARVENRNNRPITIPTENRVPPPPTPNPLSR